MKYLFQITQLVLVFSIVLFTVSAYAVAYTCWKTDMESEDIEYLESQLQFANGAMLTMLGALFLMVAAFLLMLRIVNERIRELRKQEGHEDEK